jgi:hypothetical protein
VINPIRSGTAASERARFASSRPSAARPRSTRSRLAAMPPTVNTGSMPVITSWKRPVGG